MENRSRVLPRVQVARKEYEHDLQNAQYMERRRRQELDDFADWAARFRLKNANYPQAEVDKYLNTKYEEVLHKYTGTHNWATHLRQLSPITYQIERDSGALADARLEYEEANWSWYN